MWRAVSQLCAATSLRTSVCQSAPEFCAHDRGAQMPKAAIRPAVSKCIAVRFWNRCALRENERSLSAHAQRNYCTRGTV